MRLGFGPTAVELFLFCAIAAGTTVSIVAHQRSTTSLETATDSETTGRVSDLEKAEPPTTDSTSGGKAGAPAKFEPFLASPIPAVGDEQAATIDSSVAEFSRPVGSDTTVETASFSALRIAPSADAEAEHGPTSTCDAPAVHASKAAGETTPQSDETGSAEK